MPRKSAGAGQPAARILVAEDHPVNRDVLLAVLSHLGYRADAVPNGREAVRALQTGQYSLVLMDCQMPEMDGFEATRLIRDSAAGALNPRIPIVAVTASAMAGDREKCLAAGMDDYLSKPIEPERLAQVLGRWLCGPQQPIPGAPPQAEEAPGEPFAFDHAALLKRLMGKKSLADKVVRSFLEGAPSQLSNLRRQLGAHDAPAARREAHTLKGAAATASAPALRSLALAVEQAAAAGEWATIEGILPKLEDQMERFRMAIASYQ